MPIYLYKIIHLAGIMMIFLSLGGLSVRSMLGENGKTLKKLGGAVNGIGMLLVLIAGFGLISKTGVGFQWWVIVKIAIWFVFAGLMVAANRKPEWGKPLWGAIILFGITAATLALYPGFKG